MASVEVKQRDFGVKNFNQFLTREIRNIDSRILIVSQIEESPEASAYRLDVESEGIKFSICVIYSPSEDEFSIFSLLRNDVASQPKEGIKYFLNWWDQYRDDREEGLLIDFSADETRLYLGYDDEASAYYLDIVTDIIQELLDVVPQNVRKLNQIFGNNS